MKKNTLYIALGLILLSAGLHYLHFLVFHDAHHLMIYLLGDIAFIPLEVFFVSFLIDKFIEKREKDNLLAKVNMLVGLFYQETGSSILGYLVSFDKSFDRNTAQTNAKWTEEEYKKLGSYIMAHKHSLSLQNMDLLRIRDMIDARQSLIIDLLTNQSLQENEQFTESLMSVFHLLEELRQRDLDRLTENDINHLRIDAERVYKNLSTGWVSYMTYLKKEYPYLYASALRTNPFRAD